MTTRRKDQGGYNLIEVLIAVALTGTVILSVITLFFMGRSNVYSGKQMTRAVAIGTRVMEDLSALTPGDTYTALNLTDASLTSSNTFVDKKTYLNSTIITVDPTTVYTVTNDPQGYFGRWQALIKQADFLDARIRLLVVPTEPKDSTKKLTTAEFLLLRGAVEWKESSRVRQMYFDTAKVNRQ